MHHDIIELLRCPKTGGRLHLQDKEDQNGEVRSGKLVSDDNGLYYPVRGFIPRFVAENNYANNFGMQWNHFRQTQLDSYSGHPISAKRFWKSTGWRSEELKGQWILDVGCGAGRFAEVALQAGAKVVALDYSNAVEACYSNLRHYRNLYVIQGDVFQLPFCQNSFSYVYSLGVLQHTPNAEKAFAKLPEMLKPEGKLAVDIYEKTLRSLLHLRLWLRFASKKMSDDRLFRSLQKWTPSLFRVSCMIRKIPLIGFPLSRLVPVANYTGILPLTHSQLLEWALLDTFDWLAPEYDCPQTAKTVKNWLIKAGLEDIEVFRVGHLVARGRRTHATGHRRF